MIGTRIIRVQGNGEVIVGDGTVNISPCMFGLSPEVVAARIIGIQRNGSVKISDSGAEIFPITFGATSEEVEIRIIGIQRNGGVKISIFTRSDTPEVMFVRHLSVAMSVRVGVALFALPRCGYQPNDASQRIE